MPARAVGVGGLNVPVVCEWAASYAGGPTPLQLNPHPLDILTRGKRSTENEQVVTVPGALPVARFGG